MKKGFENINTEILETFSILKNTPLMILADNSNYVYLQNYVEGYIDGLSNFVNMDLRLEINKWYKKKVNRQTTYHWTSHIPTQHKNKTDDQLQQILLDITEEYFIENPLQ